MAHVLLVGLEPKTNKNLTKIFESVDVSCEVSQQIDSAIEHIPQKSPALVVSVLPKEIQALKSLSETLRVHSPITPFIVWSKKITTQEALMAMKMGAYDCLTSDSDRYRILATAKRATSRMGRSLFVQKVIPKRSPITAFSVGLVLSVLFMFSLVKVYDGPPQKIILLGSANLSGIQWQGRELWVGDWFDSTITQYILKKSVIKSSRVLISKNIFKMQDGQPILLANSSDVLFSISSDLKMRSHQKSVGLPTLQTKNLPGANPTGLAWDGQYVWSSDAHTNMLYKHGDDLRVLESIKSILVPIQGLTHDGESFWIIGGKPLKCARLTVTKKGRVWSGPYLIDQILTEGVIPTGVTVGFDRLWLVSGGDPKMVSKKLSDITRHLTGWGDGQKQGHHAN